MRTNFTENHPHTACSSRQCKKLEFRHLFIYLGRQRLHGHGFVRTCDVMMEHRYLTNSDYENCINVPAGMDGNLQHFCSTGCPHPGTNYRNHSRMEGRTPARWPPQGLG